MLQAVVAFGRSKSFLIKADKKLLKQTCFGVDFSLIGLGVGQLELLKPLPLRLGLLEPLELLGHFPPPLYLLWGRRGWRQVGPNIGLDLRQRHAAVLQNLLLRADGFSIL